MFNYIIIMYLYINTFNWLISIFYVNFGEALGRQQ